jgi:glyoxylase-like metal-dependent hydrolase (beta-lactamase superfamily II)
MKMHMLSGGRVKMRKSTYFPGTESSEMIELPVSCILMRHPQGNVLFDTGCHPSIAESPEPRLRGMSKFMIPIMPPGDNVLTALGAIGLEPDDIDVVICSHLHPDHCGCNAFFRKATLMVHALEVAAAGVADDKALAAGYLRADWDHPVPPIDRVHKQSDVMGDGRIVLLPLPGHTPGMMGALVRLDNSGEYLLASDALAIRENLDRDIIPRNTWNAELCAKSFAEIRRLEAAGAKVICGHDAAQWEGLRKGLNAYD